MKVGDYVRTNYGISKILKLEDINTPDNIYITKIIKIGSGRFITDSEIIKSSPNIIDLIEVGDYVNGKKVLDVAIDYIFDYSEEIRIVYFDIDKKDYIYSKVDIKSIVTKEQFESMEYKVC